MATLTGEQLKDSYQSLVTIGDSITSDPTSGVLENGKGTPIDSVTIYNDATGVSDSSILNLSVLSNDANTNPRASIQAQKDGTNNGRLILNTSLSGTLTERLRIRSGGDISFRDTSANEAFYWDASEARLGIGTTSPGTVLDIHGTGNVLHVGTGTNVAQYMSFRGSGGSGAYIGYDGAGMLLQAGDGKNFRIKGGNATFNSGATGLEIDTSGNVGIGTTSVTSGYKMQVDGAIFVNGGKVAIGLDGTEAEPSLSINDGDSGFFRPSANNIGISTAGTERMRIDSSGNVGIGTQTPASGISANETTLEIADANIPALALNDTGGSKYTIYSSGGHLSFYDVTNTTERMRILSTGGITFNGDTASANALDDYEEGTWTPVYAPSSGSFTTMTMDVIGATYTKIGRQVTVRAYIRTDEVVVGTASGVLKIDGLPFSCATNGQSSISLGYISNWSTAPDGGYVNSASSSIFLHKTGVSTNSAISDLTTGAVANQNVLILNLTYFV